jgi:hypothetical protein
MKKVRIIQSSVEMNIEEVNQDEKNTSITNIDSEPIGGNGDGKIKRGDH